MNRSGSQINSVIKMYREQLTSRIPSRREGRSSSGDSVSISEEGVRRMLFERGEEDASTCAEGHEQETP